MMRFSGRLIALVTLFFMLVPAASAQRGRAGLIPHATANRMGLERVWFTRVTVDSARGRIAHIHQHVSSKRSYTVYEVAYDGGKMNFSERDLDRFGEPIGREEAEKLANQKVDDLRQRKLSPQLIPHTNPDISIYVATNRGIVQAIDGETGRTRWSTEVGSPKHVSESPGASDDYVAAVNGSRLYLLNAVTGQILWDRQTGGAPGAGPAVTEQFAFVPMLSGHVEAYMLDDYNRNPWVVRSYGRAMVQPISTGSVVAWPTDDGDLIVAEAGRQNLLFRIETQNSIVAQAAALSGKRLLVASTDGYLYCVHELSGALLWRFSTGEPIVTSPIVVGDTVYLVTGDGSLFRISSKTGTEEWWTTGITNFLSASEKHVYCVKRGGRLTMLSAETGAEIGSLAAQSLDVRFMNKQTDRIFLGSHSGVIQCLHEVSQEWPLLHINLAEEDTPEPRRQSQSTPTAAPEDRPADTDPFGGGGADPFGGGGGTDPFGGDAEADPFGGGGGSTESDPFGSDPFN
jgi:outer membrane protein assembly factor BamB